MRVDGDALVMHAGDKPYVVTPTGQVDLATKGLTLDAVDGIVGQLLSSESRSSLEEFGAVQYELPAMAEFPDQRFTVLAARGGDDLWVEVRRHRVPGDDRIPEEFFTAPAGSSPTVVNQTGASDAAGEQAGDYAPVAPYGGEAVPAASYSDDPRADLLGAGDDLALPEASQLFPEMPLAAASDGLTLDEEAFGVAAPLAERSAAIGVPEPAPIDVVDAAPVEIGDMDSIEATPAEPVYVRAVQTDEHVELQAEPLYANAYVEPVEPPAETIHALVPVDLLSEAAFESTVAVETETSVEPHVEPPASFAVEPIRPAVEPPAAVQRPQAPAGVPPVVVAPVVVPPASVPHAPFAASPPPRRAVPSPQRPPMPPPPTSSEPQPAPAPLREPVSVVAPPAEAGPPPQPAVVLPMTRAAFRGEQSVATSVADQTMDGLQRLLRISAARGASTLYLSSESHPAVRVDGELQMLDSEPVLTALEVESLLLPLMPERAHEALRKGAPTEWICDIDGVGRVRCATFRDHVGPGAVFRLMPTRTASADQLGLSKAVQALASEPEGLILVAGPRSSGKRTLISAFVDLINRTRRDFVITIEREIRVVHSRGGSFISQREVRSNDEDLLAAARAALREDPDVLVIEDLRAASRMDVAFEAASAGRLVIGGLPAPTATSAVERIVDLYAPDHRRQVQLAIAGNLRGVISQVLLKNSVGGRTPAREVLLNTSAVSGILAEGKTASLSTAIEGGRRYGMVPFNDSLMSLVQSGTVDGREAYRHAHDRASLLAAFRRQGVDTSFLERLA